jgi:hypothetical protein
MQSPRPALSSSVARYASNSSSSALVSASRTFGFIDTEMVHQGIDADPVAEQLKNTLPKMLQKRLSPAQAGEALARGIEKRTPRITAPRRWAASSAPRGIVNPPLDAYMIKDDDTQAIVRALDARADQEQPLTA